MASRTARLLIACLLAAPLLGSGVVGSGCEPTDPAEGRLKDFEAALPPTSVFELVMEGVADVAPDGTTTTPGGLETAAMPLESTQLALVGEKSGLHAATGAIRLGLKLYLKRIEATLRAVSDVVDPEFRDDTRAVWTHQTAATLLVLTMKRVEAGYFLYQIMWRPRNQPCVPWRVMLSGSYSPVGGDRLRGSGELLMDFGLDADPNTVGKALVVWSREGGDVRVTTSLYAVRLGAQGCRRIGVFDYQRKREDGRIGGMFVFQTFIDGETLDPAPCFEEQPALADGPRARGVVMSRWVASSAGRGDVILPGPEVEDGDWAFERRSQCWDADEHLVTWEQRFRKGATGQPNDEEATGDKSTCEFQEPGEPFLPPLGEMPGPMEPMAGFEDLDPARDTCD